MEHIENLFSKATTQIKNVIKKKENIISIIKELSGVDIGKKEIIISGHTITLRILGIRKIEILKKKDLIIKNLKEKNNIQIDRMI